MVPNQKIWHQYCIKWEKKHSSIFIDNYLIFTTRYTDKENFSPNKNAYAVPSYHITIQFLFLFFKTTSIEHDALLLSNSTMVIWVDMSSDISRTLVGNSTHHFTPHQVICSRQPSRESQCSCQGERLSGLGNILPTFYELIRLILQKTLAFLG